MKRVIVKPSLKTVLVLVGFLVLVFAFLLGIKIADDRLMSDFVDNSVMDIVQVAKNIVNGAEKSSGGHVVSMLMNNSRLKKEVEGKLSILISKYVRAVYLVYMDSRGHFRLIASATNYTDRLRANQILRSFSKEWKRAYISGSEVNVFHRHFEDVAITALVPIETSGTHRVMLVVDFSKSKIARSEELIRVYRDVVIVISLLTIVLIVLYGLNFAEYVKFRKIAMKDTLTGVFSRAALDEILSFINLHDYAVALIDVDHFKRVNDTFGHDVGDEVLRRVADVMKSQVRSGSDYIIRLGGEEFLILIRKRRSGNACEDTVGVLERIKKSIEESDIIVGGEKIKITVSIGVFTDTENVNNVNEAIKKADMALYQAKSEGRNRLVVWNSA